jgi:hypothetical protein
VLVLRAFVRSTQVDNVFCSGFSRQIAEQMFMDGCQVGLVLPRHTYPMKYLQLLHSQAARL